MTDSSLIPHFVPPAAGKTYSAFGEQAQFHLTGNETGGKLTMWTETVPPSGGPPPHRHLREDEWFVVQQGSFQFLIDGQWIDAAPGATVFVPKGHPHTFRNVGAQSGQLLISVSPAGFETFFAKCADAFAGGPPDMQRIITIAAEHGIEFLS